MGVRGPVPKRDSQRRRLNPPAGGPAEKGQHVLCEPPKGNTKWHPVARRWFDALAVSGQSYYYQASDWATAELLAEEMSRCLRPQYVGLDSEDRPVLYERPLGNSLSAILKGAQALMATEGDRRRLRIELERKPEVGAGGGNVSWLDQARQA